MKYPTNLRILAIDPATQMGWAFLANGVLTSGTIKWGRKHGRKHLPDDHEGKPYFDFHRWLRGVIVKDKPDVIAYEEVMRFMSGDASKKYGGFRAIIMMNAAAVDIKISMQAVGTIKKHATGKGNADKNDMIKAAKEKYPDQDIIDDNQADALHILHLYLSTVGS